MDPRLILVSRLSPTLFLMIIDHLLQKLDTLSLGPSFSGLYAGAFAHADDIRTVATSRDNLDEQICTVEEFTVTNFLSINATKTEVVVVSPVKSDHTPIDKHEIIPSASAKCLGHWWSWDISSDRALDEAIKKARGAFFSFGARVHSKVTLVRCQGDPYSKLVLFQCYYTTAKIGF